MIINKIGCALETEEHIMFKKTLAVFQKHGQLIIITFEIFWIVVFILGRLSNAGSVGVPQFVYVNF